MGQLQRLLLAILVGLGQATALAAPPDSSMEYVDVCAGPGSCRKLSRLIMGTDHLIQGGWAGDGAPELSKQQVFEVLDEAARLGINFFDTSPIYVGGVENTLGEWMKSRKLKYATRGLHALTKGGFPFDLYYSKALAAGTHSPELTLKLKQEGILSVQAALSPDGSLRLQNLPPGTYASRLYGDKEQIVRRVAEELGHSRANLNDSIAVYLMHRDDGDALRFGRIAREQTPVATLMEALSDPRISEHFWMLGWSNWHDDRVNQSIALSAGNPALKRPRFNSSYFSLFEMSPRTIHALGVQNTHRQMNDPGFQKGVLQNPYSPLGGFSILDQPNPTWENARRFAELKFRQGDPYWQNVYPSIFTPENEQRYLRVAQFTKDFNRVHGTDYTLDQMVNAYALAHKRTDFLTVGPISVEQVRRTVASLPLSKALTPSDLDYLHSGQRFDMKSCLTKALPKP